MYSVRYVYLWEALGEPRCNARWKYLGAPHLPATTSGCRCKIICACPTAPEVRSTSHTDVLLSLSMMLWSVLQPRAWGSERQSPRHRPQLLLWPWRTYTAPSRAHLFIFAGLCLSRPSKAVPQELCPLRNGPNVSTALEIQHLLSCSPDLPIHWYT